MNIEQFYDENEKRRDSAEVEFGTQWTDVRGYLYRLSWIESTGELYLMAGPYGRVIEEPILGETLGYSEPIEALTIQLISNFATLEAVEGSLLGWQAMMDETNSIVWLESQLNFEFAN